MIWAVFLFLTAADALNCSTLPTTVLGLNSSNCILPTLSGSSCILTCNQGLTSLGNLTVVCNNGTWTAAQAACLGGSISQEYLFAGGTAGRLTISAYINSSLASGEWIGLTLPSSYTVDIPSTPLSSNGGAQTSLSASSTVMKTNPSRMTITLTAPVSAGWISFIVDGVSNPVLPSAGPAWQISELALLETPQSSVLLSVPVIMNNTFTMVTGSSLVGRQTVYIGVVFTPTFSMLMNETITLQLPPAFDFTLTQATGSPLTLVDASIGLTVSCLNIPLNSTVRAYPDNRIDIRLGGSILSAKTTAIYVTSWSLGPGNEVIFNPLTTGSIPAATMTTPRELFSLFPPLVLSDANGLNYRNYSSGSLTSLPVFSQLLPRAEGIVQSISTAIAQNVNGPPYALTLDGFVQLNSAGIYTFYFTSVDGGRISIDNGAQTVNNDGLNFTVAVNSSSLYRSACRYPIAIEYFHNDHPAQLQLEYEILSTRQLVSSSMLFTSQVAYGLVEVWAVSGCPTQNGTKTSLCLVDGQSIVNITGRNLHSPQRVRIGSLDCNITGSTPNGDWITCSLPVQYGTHRVYVKTLCGVGLSTEPLVEYYPTPTLDSQIRLLPSGNPSSSVNATSNSGGDEVEFTGQNFGWSNSSLEVFIGYRTNSLDFRFAYAVKCNVTEHNETYARCTVPPGAGCNLAFAVRVAGFLTSKDSTFTLSYPPPWFDDARFSLLGVIAAPVLNGTKSQGDIVIIHGGDLGDPTDISASRVLITYGPDEDIDRYQCVLEPSASDDLKLQCGTSRGNGGPYKFRIGTPNNPVLASAGKIMYSTISSTVFYYPIGIPVVSSVTGCSTPKGYGTSGCPTDGGGTILTITGDNYIADSFISITVGESDCTPYTVVNQTTLTCTLPAGRGVNRMVTVLRDSFLSEPQPLLSYAPPTITSLEGCGDVGSALLDCVRTGNNRITIYGENFGASNAVVLVAGAECMGLQHTPQQPHRELTCTLQPGTRTNLTVLVVQFGQFSGPGFTVSYEQCAPGFELRNFTCNPCPNGTARAADQPICTRCAPGFFSASLINSACQRCDYGTYTEAQGAQVCNICPAGTFSSTAATACSLCTPGRFSASSQQGQCNPCDAGWSQNNTGASACVPCYPGFFQVATGKESCDPCLLGSYAPNMSATTCLSCNPGFVQPDLGQASCNPCSAGRWAGPGFKDCLSCGPGTYSAADRASTCESCDVFQYQELSGQSNCSNCPIGKQGLGTGQASCSDCPAGRFQNITGQTVCGRCPPGFSSPPGNSSCTRCGLGYAQDQWESADCVACEAGEIVKDPSDPQICEPCTRGFYARNNGTALFCELCPVGSASNFPGVTACLPCQLGRSIDIPGQISCSLCAEGRFANVTGNANCSDCAPGRYQLTRGQSFCSDCERGRYSNTTGLSVLCADCSPGQWSNNGWTTCQPCPIGKVVNGSGVCDDCPAGQIVNSTNLAECIACDRGKYASGLSCTSCFPGTYSLLTGSVNCTLCEPGYYTSQTGATVCDLCVAGSTSYFPAIACQICDDGQFSASPGSRNCTNCGFGRWSSRGSVGATRCIDCALGFYNDNERAASCIPCPLGKYTATQGQQTCEQCGKNRYLLQTNISGLLVSRCEACPKTGAICADGLLINDRDYYIIRDPLTDRAIVRRCPKEFCGFNSTCTAHRKPYDVNPLCGQCEQGYYEWGSNCLKCDGIDWDLVCGYFILSWVWVLIFHKAAQTTRGDTKIFLYFVQVVLIVFGQEIDSLFQWMRVFDFNVSDVSGESCVAPMTPIEKIVLELIIPGVCLLQLVLTASLHGLFHLARRHIPQINGGPEIPSQWHWAYIRSMVGLVLFTYAGLSKATLQIFNCENIAGSSYMVSSPTVDCKSSAYRGLFATAVVLLLCAVIAIPIILLVFLKYHKRRHNFETEWFIIKYGILTQTYTRRRYWWEFAAIFRRTILIAVTIIFGERETRHTVLTLCNLAFLITHMKFRPFLKKIENWLENVSLFLLSLITVILIKTGAPPLSVFARVLLFLLVIFPGFLLLVYVLLVRGMHLSGTQGPKLLNKEQDDTRRRDIMHSLENQEKLKQLANWAEEDENEGIPKLDGGSPPGSPRELEPRPPPLPPADELQGDNEGVELFAVLPAQVPVEEAYVQPSPRPSKPSPMPSPRDHSPISPPSPRPQSSISSPSLSNEPSPRPQQPSALFPPSPKPQSSPRAPPSPLPLHHDDDDFHGPPGSLGRQDSIGDSREKDEDPAALPEFTDLGDDIPPPPFNDADDAERS